ncbi:MAG: hypothetical protein Q4C99_01920 [Clostridia bacterium]|nr:hypothetical protein [Clostridia bacterium]
MKKAATIFQTVGIFAVIVLFVVFSAKAKAQAIEGMKMCINIIVPSLLPILILTNTVIKSECSTVFEFIFRPIAKLLKLPSAAVCVIFFGLIGGYPTGAVLTDELFEQGIISEETAKRLLRFNFCGGIAFIITAVGTIKLGNTKAGIIIYLTNIFSSITICIIESLFAQKEEYTNIKIKKTNFSSALINSVEGSVKSIAIMCGYIVFFSALSGLFTVPNFLMPMIEITNGVFANGNTVPFEYLCFFLCFGGICIHFQLFGIIKKVNMSYFDFFIHRLAGGLLAYFPGKLYSVWFAPNEEVFANISQATPKMSEINGSLSLMLLASCVVIVVDLNNKKSKLL